ncbi:MAG: pentapeptide repeat-containing protein [Stenomitos rutilans HA7619-LM2]|jgi:uncharacterized protein YjbI with pentapeptide repeats|nr:pentapeptide repeat-containing protein [Stenomitos rutilans HA7619-LM2]
MKTDQQKYHKAKSIQGKRFGQNSLNIDFQSKSAGQQVLFKNVLALLTIILSVLANVLAGYVGGFISLYGIIDNPARSQLHITFLIVLVVLVSAITQDIIKVTLTLFVSLGIVIALSILLGVFGLIQGFSAFLITTIVATGLCLGLSAAGFLAIRFIIAVADILFINSNFLKIVIVVSGVSSATISCFGVIADVLERKSLPYSKILLTSPLTYWTVLLLGAGYGVFLTLIAWLANYLRETPWSYPGLQRFWALIVGSWWGTSFANLDLSNVNFTNAKLANSDLRAQNLYRTCFQGVVGLERARVDNQYLDLEYPKVQRLLTHGSSRDKDFRGFNLRGAYLQGADMREFDFTDINLTGADLKSTDLKSTDLRGSTLIRTQLAGADFQRVDLRKNILIDANLTEANLRNADLRDCILVRAQVARADFSGADLTGICIEDWSVSSKTNFTEVRCDYIYRRYRDGQPTDRYPVDRNFEPGEFASLFQQPENELELVFKGEEFDYTALSLTFDKLQTDKPDLKLKLQGIEQRQDLWVVKVTSDDPANVERRIKEIQDAVYQGYEVTATRLENSPLFRRLVSDLANVKKTQEETNEEVKQLAKRIGSNFYFVGGTITNVTGAGEIRYTEASNQVRSLVTGDGHETQVVNTLLNQLRSSNVATTANEQTELIQLIILEEAQRDPQFKQSLLQQEQQILAALPERAIATAIQNAIAQLNGEGSSSIV